MAGVQDHETVSGYPLDPAQLEQLLVNARECTFNWRTADGWPVGVILAYLWKDGRFWVTMGAHRHRVAAVRRDPRVSVVVSSASALPGTTPAGAATAKGRAVIHESRETKDWFYRDFSRKLNPHPAAAEAFAARLDSPIRIVIEVVPEKWILFDAGKFAKDSAGTLADDERGPLLESDAARLPRELARRGLG